jgi:hypothetical protein
MPSNGNGHGPPVRRRRGPGIVAPANKVTLALPFSRVEFHEPSQDVAELAAVVVELAKAVEELVPVPELTALRDRAELLAQRLR